ncbi:MAG: hypothetical protein JXB49_05225 [Bacteroidales bacterium]|nr:hypothetical protein [Bacteroidales bacterium]
MSVLSYLQTTASNLVLSANERTSIDNSIATLRTRLVDYSGGSIIEQIKFGSYTRATILPRRADPQSDIDYMIVFDNVGNNRPQTFIDRLRRFAEARYSTSEVHQSHPTVVLELNHIMFDLVPAYRSSVMFGSILYIPGPRSSYADWITTDPNAFNSRLTERNNSSRDLIKPMIRLVKYWNASNDYVYYSYELEQKLLDNWYMLCNNLKDYFYVAINNLNTAGLPQYKIDKVQRAKDIITRVKNFESSNLSDSAETEITKLIPQL